MQGPPQGQQQDPQMGRVTPQGGVKYERYNPYPVPAKQETTQSFGAPFDPKKMEPIYGRRGWEVIGYNVQTPTGPERIWLSDQERITLNNANGEQVPIMAVMSGAWNRAHKVPTESPIKSEPQGPPTVQDPMIAAPMPAVNVESDLPPPDYTKQSEALELIHQKYPGIQVTPVSYDKVKISFPDGTDRNQAKQISKEIDGLIETHIRGGGNLADPKQQMVQQGIAEASAGQQMQMPAQNNPLQGAIADYKQDQQNMVVPNAGMDKSMEYRGMQQQAVMPARPGRGQMKF